MNGSVVSSTSAWENRRAIQWVRGIIPLAVMSIFLLDPDARAPIITALTDAYLAVGIFVAGTLWLFYSIEQHWQIDTAQTLQSNPHWQIPLAAILGALPGCGGAIIVVSQYAQGSVGFSALVTVLISTMGDAAFLLLAQAPGTGAAVIATGIVAGVVSGYFIEWLHGPDFLRANSSASNHASSLLPQQNTPNSLKGLWLALFILGLPVGILLAFQVDIAPYVIGGNQVDGVQMLGLAGALLALGMWALLPTRPNYQTLVAEDNMAETDDYTQPTPPPSSTLQRTIRDTNFVLAWVIAAFLLFELGMHYTGWDLSNLFSEAPWLAPLVGVVIGFLPGCGPQIIVATLYLNGVVPLSALIGNAISNDGDALFPAIALVPKAAIYATLYSAIPAMVVAYATYFWLD